jgi:homeodomain-containing protein
MPKKTFQVQLSLAERARLQTLVTNGSSTAHTHIHARILLKADEGPEGPAWTDAMISSALDVGMSSVARVRQTAVQEGLSAALQRTVPKRVYQRTLDGAGEAHLVALTCSTPPEGAGRWSLRLLAERMVELEYVAAISHETVRQTLKKTNSSPGA